MIPRSFYWRLFWACLSLATACILAVAVPAVVLLAAGPTGASGQAIGVAAGAWGLAALACLWLAHTQTAAVGALSRRAAALSQGDLTHRAAPSGAEEINTLGKALARIADAMAQAQTQTAQHEEDRRAILESMHDGVIAADRQQRVFLANSAAAAFLGFASDALPGRPLWEVVREEMLLKGATQVLASGAKVSVQWGPQRGCYFVATLSPLVRQQRVEGVLIVVRDETKEVQYQELRKEFVSNVSHELRTPLAVIKGFVETLSDGALHDPVRGPQYLATVEKHINQLANLVNDLLELSRLESRPGLPKRTPVNLAARIAKVLDVMLPAARKKSQALTAKVPTYLPAISGDADYIERAISNLVDNAVKYTPEGGRIEVSAALGDGKVIITVSDNGIGMPPEDLPRIFERFYRVDKSRSRDMGGTGLGLAIVKHVSAAHNGSIEVSSELGRGSTFRLILPTIPDASAAGSSANATTVAFDRHTDAAIERGAQALAGN